MSKKKLYIRDYSKQGSLGLSHYTEASEADICEAGYTKVKKVKFKREGDQLYCGSCGEYLYTFDAKPTRSHFCEYCGSKLNWKDKAL